MLTIGPSLFFYATTKYLRALQVATCNGNFLRICENVTKKLVMTSRVPLRRVVNCNAPAQQRCRAPRAAPARAITDHVTKSFRKSGHGQWSRQRKFRTVGPGLAYVLLTKPPFCGPLRGSYSMGLGTLGWSGGQRSKVWADCTGWTDEIRWLQATQNRGVGRSFKVPVSRSRRALAETTTTMGQHHEVYYKDGLRSMVVPAKILYWLAEL